MGMQDRVKPISFLKQNGEAKAILQDVGAHEATQDMLALLKLLALGREDMAAGRTAPVEGLADRIRAR